MRRTEKSFRVITKQFVSEVKKIFGKNLVFAFICGSFAKKTMHSKSDIDMFICVKRVDRKEKQYFHEWYTTTHSQYDFKPDIDFGEEILTYKNLLRKIKMLDKYKPSQLLRDKNLYDGIVWAGMLSGEIVAFVGHKKYFKKVKLKSARICKYWAKRISPLSKVKDHGLLLKRLVKYKSK